MKNSILPVLLLAAAPAFSADRLGMMSVDAPTQPANTCKIAHNDRELLKALEGIGWKPGPSNFPTVDFSRNIALVVATRKKDVLPDDLFAEYSMITIEVDQDDAGTGAVVVAAPIRRATACQVAQVTRSAQKEDRGLYSVNSAGEAPKRLPIAKQPALPAKTPPGRTGSN